MVSKTVGRRCPPFGPERLRLASPFSDPAVQANHQLGSRADVVESEGLPDIFVHCARTQAKLDRHLFLRIATQDQSQDALASSGQALGQTSISLKAS